MWVYPHPAWSVVLWEYYRMLVLWYLLLTFDIPSGAGKEAWTPDIYLGKVVLYQLSYARINLFIKLLLSGAPVRNRTDFSCLQDRTSSIKGFRGKLFGSLGQFRNVVLHDVNVTLRLWATRLWYPRWVSNSHDSPFEGDASYQLGYLGKKLLVLLTGFEPATYSLSNCNVYQLRHKSIDREPSYLPGQTHWIVSNIRV